jgi:glycosyltransferase involved in cell wall biosynthesis
MTAPVRVAYIFIRYPVLSQRFMQREIAALAQHQIRAEIYSLLQVGGAGRHAAGVDYFRWWEAVKLAVALPRELARDPGLLRDAWRLLRGRRPSSAENFLSNLWAAIFAICRAQQFRCSKPQILHGAWATAPATAAAILSRLCGIPFSFGAHAYDIYRRGGDAFLQSKLRTAAFVHTTTVTNVAYLKERGGGAPVILARRGLDELPAPAPRLRHTEIRILSVGRLVAKKGHSDQLAACSLLQEKQIPFHLRIIGDGPLRAQLEKKIKAANLADFVTLCGALNPSDVDQAYRWADIFWHTGIVDLDGDRDGLPNVIPEAFTHNLPVICSRTAGPMEAVTDNETGLVADANNPVQLAAAVERLARDPRLRQRLGENGRRWTEQNFLAATNTALLATAFRNAVRQS